jgi:hypothetical protein
MDDMLICSIHPTRACDLENGRFCGFHRDPCQFDLRLSDLRKRNPEAKR